MKKNCGMLRSLILCILFVNSIAIKRKSQVDLSDLDDVFTTDSLPDDERYMSSIGNGHLATDVFSETLFMNGLYNGERGESHRARIPAWCNIQISNSTLEAEKPRTFYSLDTTGGVFIASYESEKWTIEQRIFAHRYYTRAIVNQFVIFPKGTEKSIIKIERLPGNKSDDILFGNTTTQTIENQKVWKTCGRTLVVENSKYQKDFSKLCIFMNDIPENLEINPGNSTVYTFIVTVDPDEEIALKEIRDALREENLYENHKIEWLITLNSGRIQIQGNLHLSKVVNGAWYYLLSSLPSINSNQPLGKFYGLSPGGLSRGAYLRDYQGHSFWDTETWMFPSILLMQPKIAKSILQYRVGNVIPAADLAELSGHKGIRFPWESGFTGAEVTPDCCPEVVDFEHHISGCIAFAVRQYIAMTNDTAWLEKDGCSLIKNIAEFWASRAEFNDETGFYDINEVMGPDEDHPNVTNSVFTNVIAGLALYLGDYGSCLCDTQNITKAANWSAIASKLTLVYDAELNYHPQYEEYERPTMIKQADVVLLGFPLMYRMHPSTRENDLLYYENVTRDNGPAMTWSMHSVGHLQLGNNEQAAMLFNKSYQPYVREPFKIWTEAREPEIGAVNFITGMGGFLQAIMFGYAGINIHLDRLEIVNPQLIPNTTGLKIDGIEYLGSNFSLSINENVQLIVDRVNSDQPLILHTENTKIPLISGITVPLNGKGPFQIKREFASKCSLPLDLIGQQ